MRHGPVLLLSSGSAGRLEADLDALGYRTIVASGATVVPPPDPRPWSRALSELALFNWLILPTPAAVGALVDGVGALPARTLRMATVGAAGAAVRELGREPDLEAASLSSLMARLAARLGRRQRVLAPRVAVGGQRIRRWLAALGADAVCPAAYDLEVSLARSIRPPVAVLADPQDAEMLAYLLRTAQVAARPVMVSLEQAAADAADDCGLITTLLDSAALGPFLEDALS